VSVSFGPPARIFTHWQLVVADRLGNRSTLLLINPVVTYTVSGGRVVVHGSGYTPGALVTATYHGRFMTSTRADARGSLSLSFVLPHGASPSWLLELREPAGHYATAIQMGTTPVSATERTRPPGGRQRPATPKPIGLRMQLRSPSSVLLVAGLPSGTRPHRRRTA
jgi:hypothetical protein